MGMEDREKEGGAWIAQGLPNESDVYKTPMRYRDKVCFEKNMETKKPRQAQRGSRKKLVNQRQITQPWHGARWYRWYRF